MRHLVREAGLEHAVEIDSAGTAAYHVGESPDRRARAAAKRRGIDVSGSARRFERADFARFDYVIAMDCDNHATLVGRGSAPDRQKIRSAARVRPGFRARCGRAGSVLRRRRRLRRGARSMRRGVSRLARARATGARFLMDARVRAAVEQALGATVERTARLGGGDINEAFEVRLAGGRRIFVKQNQSADPAMFPAEARGLAWLAAAKALRVPEVIAVSSSPAFLALEYLEPARHRRDFDEELGRGLAALHRFGAASFGLDHDNFIGRLPQINTPEADWPTFYRTRRLEPMMRHLDAALARRFDALFARLPELVGPAEPPARLHGDLWGGNLHADEAGAPCLIDPAVYGGHREVDLAMMRLFGGFSPRVFDAYAEAYPLPEGHEARVPLYQLYPLLVHVGLFGAGYIGSVQRALAKVL